MTSSNSPISWFRGASPYISSHRGKTFVVYLPGHGVSHDSLHDIIQDLVLLTSLGVRLVVVHGAAPQINQALEANNLNSEFASGIRITTPEILPIVENGVRQSCAKLESEFSKLDVNLASGNHIKAKPLGIENGIDFHNTGRVRKINTQGIRKQLDYGAIVVISPLGYSPSGELFNINSLEVAGEVASALLADKLIILDHDIRDEKQNLVNEIQVSDIDTSQLGFHDHLSAARRASLQGVNRCHLLDINIDGALLAELYTRDGIGTQVIRKSYEQVRRASPEDVSGIIALIEPLEDQGVLVKRSRELLESEIDKFFVIDLDGKIVACAALYNYGHDAELACLVTHPDYRDGTRGEILLDSIRNTAFELDCKNLFVLTTHTAHWFTEHGFKAASLDDLPVERQQLYNYQRNSKLFVSTIEKSSGD
jgi:amino-acid N-acetyltransferase